MKKLVMRIVLIVCFSVMSVMPVSCFADAGAYNRTSDSITEADVGRRVLLEGKVEDYSVADADYIFGLFRSKDCKKAIVFFIGKKDMPGVLQDAADRLEKSFRTKRIAVLEGDVALLKSGPALKVLEVGLSE